MTEQKIGPFVKILSGRTIDDLEQQINKFTVPKNIDVQDIKFSFFGLSHFRAMIVYFAIVNG